MSRCAGCGAGVRPAAPSTEGELWRRVHPITPAVKGWEIFAAALTVIGVRSAQSVQDLAGLVGGRVWVVVLLLLGAVFLVGFGYSALSWQMTRFVVTDDAVRLRTGVLFRQQRQVQLDRLQAVDVVQPLLARLFGLAELRFEVAGGAGSTVSLAFLREAEADQVRADVLARAAGLHRTPDLAAPTLADTRTRDSAEETVGSEPAGTAQPGGGPGGVAPTAPERVVFAVPMARLAASTALTGAMFWLVASCAVLVVMIGTRSLGPVIVILPGVFAIASSQWERINHGANFRAAISPDGIRLWHGLTETRARTVPPGRVQAVRVYQNVLWRCADWWRVEMNVAGYHAAGDGEATDTVLLPVGTRQDAQLALWLVLPELGVDDPQAVLEAALTGSGMEQGFLTAPRRSHWLDPVVWRRTGVKVTERALLIRSGRFTRSLVVVPHERTQSLMLSQGPLERRMGLASFAVHSTPGPVTPRVRHLDSDDAAQLIEDQSARARAARAGAGPEQWMREP